MNSDAYMKWRDCECEACKALAEVAHDNAAWNEQLEVSKKFCPNWSPDIYEDAAPEG